MLPFLFQGRKPLVGVVHLAPLPGTPRWRAEGKASLDEILERAREQASGLLATGFDGLIVENYGDAPFERESVPPEIVASMALAVGEVMGVARGAPVGVNVLRNDARAALGIAVACGARFVRVNVHQGVAATDQGIVVGRAAETLRARDLLAASGEQASVAIWADVHVKHARPLDSDDVARAASDAVERALADAVLVSGPATGEAPDEAHVRRAREGARGAPLLLASGLTRENAGRLVPLVDGAIAASDALEGGRAGARVDAARARALVAAFRSACSPARRSGRPLRNRRR
ncbi:BtpA/SgcQ family protein [bacterium]|nr:BtpA/SgcQ family protein [bacterium]